MNAHRRRAIKPARTNTGRNGNASKCAWLSGAEQDCDKDYYGIHKEPVKRLEILLGRLKAKAAI